VRGGAAPAALDVRPRGSSRSLLVRSADGLDTFVGLLSPQGVLLDANAMTPDRPDFVSSSAFGNDFWDARLWSWSPVVQQRLKAAVERAATGDLVRYDETMRVRGNHLVTIDITLLPLLTHEGISTIVCSIIDSSAALRADRHWADRQLADRQLADRHWADRERTPQAC
jgi:hypothetical protein